eukprot:260887_1
MNSILVYGNPIPVIQIWVVQDFLGNKTGYVFEASNCTHRQSTKGNLLDPKKGQYSVLHEYGTKCKNGDIVVMTLDLNSFSLRFAINDQDYGVAFANIEDTEYRAAIFMYVYGTTGRNRMYKTGCVELIVFD